MKVLCNMFMRSWAILGFNRLTICSRHNIGGVGCNYRSFEPQNVSRCVVCDWVRASFNTPTPQLQPLPIMGLGYWWSLDFASPLSLTPWHNRYVLVMIEHFSKWLELVPLLDYSNEGNVYAFCIECLVGLVF